ncbi:hypothetical protein LMG27198_41380 [Methylocystis echinoides]|uniref:Uncharacterized protein n=1 Tax=Methylocystis echinoides TaxID=29468 RepID=A0A9W6GY89_9HYPH|nr:hypothetical protein LMG27198_41380 [Methylocystis echinoides]
MDWPSLDIRRQRRTTVRGMAKGVEQSPQHRFSDWHADRRAGRVRDCSAPEAGGVLKRNGADGRGVEMLLHLCKDGRTEIPVDHNRVGNRRKLAWREANIDHGAPDCDDLA